MATIQEVKDAHTEAWMALPGVTGVGIGLCGDEPCIRVFLAGPSRELGKEIPNRVDGYRVERVVTGTFDARSSRDPGA